MEGVVITELSGETTLENRTQLKSSYINNSIKLPAVEVYTMAAISKT